MTMQEGYFEDGSFYIHKIPSENGAVLSGFYNADGELRDFSKRLRNGNQVNRCSQSDMEKLISLGKVWKKDQKR